MNKLQGKGGEGSVQWFKTGLVIVTLTVLLAGCASKIYQHPLRFDAPTPDTAEVYIIWPTMGLMYIGHLPLDLFANKQKLLSLGKERYARIWLKPGRVTYGEGFLSHGLKIVPTEFWFEAGKTYYIAMELSRKILPLQSKSHQLFELGFDVPEGKDGRIPDFKFFQGTANTQLALNLISREEAAHHMGSSKPVDEGMAFDPSLSIPFIKPQVIGGSQFVIDPPDKNVWQHDPKFRNLRFQRTFDAGRKTENQIRSMETRSAVLIIDTVPTHASSPKRLVERIKEELDTKEGGYLKEFRSYDAPCEGRPCRRYDWRVEAPGVHFGRDSAPGAFTDTTFILEGHGFVFLHPRQGGVILIDLFYAQTYRLGEDRFNLESEIRPVIQSLRFE